MDYGGFEDFSKRTATDKAFNIAKNSKYFRYQRGFASVVYNVFVKKTR